MPQLTQDLIDGSAVVELLVSVTGRQLKKMSTAGLSLPEIQHLSAIIDTGASNTCIDSEILRRFNLEPTQLTSLSTATTGTSPVTADVFEVALVVPHRKQQPLMIPNIKVTAIQVSAGRHVQAILGRDVLARCTFLYDGPAGTFTLDW